MYIYKCTCISTHHVLLHFVTFCPVCSPPEVAHGSLQMHNYGSHPRYANSFTTHIKVLKDAQVKLYGCFLKWWVETPQIIHLFIGFSIISTIHFGGPPLFLETPIWQIMVQQNTLRPLFITFHNNNLFLTNHVCLQPPFVLSFKTSGGCHFQVICFPHHL